MFYENHIDFISKNNLYFSYIFNLIRILYKKYEWLNKIKEKEISIVSQNNMLRFVTVTRNYWPKLCYAYLKYEHKFSHGKT